MKCRRKSCQNSVVDGYSTCRKCLDIQARYTAKTRVKTRSDVCECSEPKELMASGCPDCTDRDGVGSVANLISALRVLGGRATFASIKLELGYAETNVYRAIRRATAEGRVVQVQQWESGIPNLQSKVTIASENKVRSASQARVNDSRNGTKHDCPAIFVLRERGAL